MRSTLFAVLVTIGATGCSNDHSVALVNTKVDQHGLFVADGFATELGGPFGKYTFLGTLTGVGARSGNGEVAAFGATHSVTLRPVAWSSSPAIVQVPVAANVPLSLSVWIVKGPFAQQKTKAMTDVAQTAATYSAERLGMFFNIVEVLDVTGNAAAATYFNFDCSQKAAMQTALGRHDQRINIYYVDQVKVSAYATTNGNACKIGGDFVVMGSAAGADLLAHEIGHTLALEHTDEIKNATLKAAFDSTNVMWSFSSNRAYMSEGQTFRATFDPASEPNISPGKPRLGEPVRSCGTEMNSRTCPTIQRRLWADGSFPAN